VAQFPDNGNSTIGGLEERLTMKVKLPPEWLVDGPEAADVTLALAHGAGAAMDSDFMQAFANGLAQRGIRVVRFEFPYMAQRRQGIRRPPDREPVLRRAWAEVIETLGPAGLVIGGKSLGGRIASLVADESGVAGLVCLGYPFHPSGEPERLRTGHLKDLQTRTLILQGERDPLGSRAEVAGYELSGQIRLHWLADGDHSFVPRKSSGRTQAENWHQAIDAVADFLTG
jgi:predicted alpha/beta-hydrolase family hydrolase